MKSILYPIDKVQSNRDGTKTTSTNWQAMNPLDMAKMIANLAISHPGNPNHRLALVQHEREKPPQVKIDFLLQDVPIPNLPIAAKNHHKFLQKRTSQAEKEYKTAKDLKKEDKKRKSSMLDDDESNAIVVAPPPPLLPWDPSFLHMHNPFSANTRISITELKSLSRTLEAMPKSYEYMCSYKRMREATFAKSKSIAESNLPKEQKEHYFNQMYIEIINHMRTLIKSVQDVEEDGSMPDSDPFKAPVLIEPPPIIGREFKRKEFAKAMTAWLKANWTNPYPDEFNLQLLCAMNSASSTTVNNWLINARTRKWRPSIVKAYNLLRPVELLKEDSMNIFDKKPLRDVPAKKESKKK